MIVEELVLAVVAAGLADMRLVHLPATHRTFAPSHGSRRVAFVEVCRSQLVPPYEWPAACGIVGVVYARHRDGVFAETTICATCSRLSSCSFVESAPVASAA